MLVQYAGDYRAAYRRLAESGQETYYGHRYVLDQLQLAHEEFGDVAVLCCLTDEEYHETLPTGVKVLGAAAHPMRQAGRVNRVIEEWDPTHLVIQGPMTALIRSGIRHERRMMVTMANSFEARPRLLTRLRNVGLVPAVNHDRVDWVTNHGVNACRSAVRFGVRRDKVIPWDWPYDRSPGELPPRELADGPVRLVYVGSVSAKKGVGDLIDGVGVLRAAGRDVHLSVIGGGDIARFRAAAEDAGVPDRVDFRGQLPNDQVFDAMRAATAVVVPSRRAYPEGLPLTIYEALCARTPIVASDHPMFAGHLRDRETAMVFSERDPDALAAAVIALVDDPQLYAAISRATEDAWTGMQNPTKWGDILRHWLRSESDDRSRQWLADRRLDAVAPDGALRINAPG